MAVSSARVRAAAASPRWRAVDLSAPAGKAGEDDLVRESPFGKSSRARNVADYSAMEKLEKDPGAWTSVTTDTGWLRPMRMEFGFGI